MNEVWNLIKGVAVRDANRYLYVPIPHERSDMDASEPLQPHRSYLRLWLSELFLTKNVNWFQAIYPAVHASVMLKFADYAAVIFSRVIQAPDKALANGVLMNYPITDLIPFNGGLVEIEASLFELHGKNNLTSALKVLQTFSSLVGTPLATAITVAEKVSSGMNTLIQANNKNKVHLPFHQTYTSQAAGANGNVLKPGYVAVILATQNQVNGNDLLVEDGRLYRKSGQKKELFRGFDFMLLKVEGRDERDDWRLRTIEEPYNKAVEAWFEGNLDKADSFKRVAITTALTSPDLSHTDRRRVATVLKKEFEDLEGGGLAFAGGEATTLDSAIANYPVSLAELEAKGEPTFAEFLGDQI